MPRLTRYFLKAAVVYFVLAILIPLFQILPIQGWFSSLVSTLQPVYFHFFMLGWATQMIIGVSLWMFPGRKKTEPHARTIMGWIIFFMLNIGLVLRAIGEPMISLSTASAARVCIAFSVALQFMGGLIYAFLIWGRIQGK